MLQQSEGAFRQERVTRFSPASAVCVCLQVCFCSFFSSFFFFCAAHVPIIHSWNPSCPTKLMCVTQITIACPTNYEQKSWFYWIQDTSLWCHKGNVCVSHKSARQLVHWRGPGGSIPFHSLVQFYLIIILVNSRFGWFLISLCHSVCKFLSFPSYKFHAISDGFSSLLLPPLNRSSFSTTNKMSFHWILSLEDIFILF